MLLHNQLNSDLEEMPDLVGDVDQVVKQMPLLGRLPPLPAPRSACFNDARHGGMLHSHLNSDLEEMTDLASDVV
jgi:hypothetical protein